MSITVSTRGSIQRATKFFRKLRGGSQACLVQVECGDFYVVKFLHNPQGSRVLFHEALGTELMRHLGLPVPTWAPIEVSDTFIDQNRGLWFHAEEGRLERPPSGLHFGSKLLANGKAEVAYEVIPRNWFRRIVNRNDFIGALLFDLLACQTDNRQAIFVQQSDNYSLRAVFIDQGSVFGGDVLDHSLAQIRHMYLDPKIYTELDFDSVVPFWISRLRLLNRDWFASLKERRQIPIEWYTPDVFHEIIESLIRRQALLDRYSIAVKLTLSRCCLGKFGHPRSDRDDDLPIRSPQLRASDI